LQESFGIIMLAIANKRPKVFNIKEILQSFIAHRKEVVVRRSIFELRKAQMRAHILEGYEKALDKIDAVIELIRGSKTPDEARTGLIKKFEFTMEQSVAILEMRLQRLTGLEREKIQSELKELKARIAELKTLLGSQAQLFQLIRTEAEHIKKAYGDERRTKIIGAVGKMVTEDLIPEEEMVVTVSHTGYVKRLPTNSYRAQKRGGTGKVGMTTKEEDFVEKVFVASTHSFLLLFTDKGRLLWQKVYELPLASRTAKGRPLINMVRLAPDEKICGILPVRKFEEGRFVVMGTEQGVIKKIDLMQFSHPRPSGIIAISFDDGDKLIGAALTNGKDEILLSTKDGLSIRFSEEDVRAMGRSARGVKGIELNDKDRVVSLDIVNAKAQLLTVSEFGYGKRTDAEEYRSQTRGGKGIITIKTTDRNGGVVAALQVQDSDQVMIVTDGGKLIRMKAAEISIIGRNTAGMRLISLEEGEKVTSVTRISEEDEESSSKSTESEN
jgi:DNA gyrase subunit A